MARWIRIWGKKRGRRRSGSRWMGGVGESLFFASLFFLGILISASLLPTGIAPSESSRAWINVWILWLMILIAGSLVLLGGAGFVISVMKVGTSAERRQVLTRKTADAAILGPAGGGAASYPNVPGGTNLVNSPGTTLKYRLPIGRSEGWRLLAWALLALVWNAVVAAMTVVVVRGYLARQPDWVLTVTVGIFLLIGLWAGYGFVRLLLITAGIGPTVMEISDHPLYPGQCYRIAFSQSGRLSFESLEVSLACDEAVAFLQGTDIRTESSRTFHQSVFRHERFSIRPDAPFARSCELPIPERAMHSFQSEHNAIQWKIVVRGEPIGWPSFERAFPVVVFPETPGDGETRP